jgi:hypothetical protein
MQWLKGLFGGDAPATAPKKKKLERRLTPLPELVMRADATLPIVDWKAMDAHVPDTKDRERLDKYWTGLARVWLETLGKAVNKSYAVAESDHFLLLSTLDNDGAKPVLRYVENCRRGILKTLSGVAKETEVGKVCLLILGDHDLYYKYVANYYPPTGEFSLSGGMFLQHGYGHFVFVADDLQNMEPVIAHELTHCLVQHLPIPAWLNEGIAVNTERYISPPWARPLFTPEEMHEKHVTFWNETTIQEFWSGKSWLRPDEANMLSYDLAQHFVNMVSSDYGEFCSFANAADAADGGAAAAEKYLGFPISHLAEAILGEGPWQPKPELWKEGVERGQFRSAPPLNTAAL